MNLGRRLAQLEDETAPAAEVGSWRTLDGETDGFARVLPSFLSPVEAWTRRPAGVVARAMESLALLISPSTWKSQF